MIDERVKEWLTWRFPFVYQNSEIVRSEHKFANKHYTRFRIQFQFQQWTHSFRIKQLNFHLRTNSSLWIQQSQFRFQSRSFRTSHMRLQEVCFESNDANQVIPESLTSRTESISRCESLVNPNPRPLALNKRLQIRGSSIVHPVSQ